MSTYIWIHFDFVFFLGFTKKLNKFHIKKYTLINRQDEIVSIALRILFFKYVIIFNFCNLKYLPGISIFMDDKE